MFRLLCFAIIRLLHYLLDACMCKTIGCDTLVISRESVGVICIISNITVICYLHVFTILLKAYICIYIYIYMHNTNCKLLWSLSSVFAVPRCTACTVLYLFWSHQFLFIALVKGSSCVAGSCCGIHDFTVRVAYWFQWLVAASILQFCIRFAAIF
jgi:hypothetical protein